jgi:hypothetical protein
MKKMIILCASVALLSCSKNEELVSSTAPSVTSSVPVVASEAAAKGASIVTISQKLNPYKSGLQFVLKSVSNDSRCPDGVQCIWAGEVTAVVAVYNKTKLIEEKVLTISTANEKINFNWYSSYFPYSTRVIKNIYVLPYPQLGVAVAAKDYTLQVEY